MRRTARVVCMSKRTRKKTFFSFNPFVRDNRVKDEEAACFTHQHVSDASVAEGQNVDHGSAAHKKSVAALLVIHADIVLRSGEVEPRSLCNLTTTTCYCHNKDAG